MMGDGMLAATAWHDPKNIPKMVADATGQNGDGGRDPQEPSDFEQDWTWGKAAASK
jgi:hypothetical protein